MFKIFYLNQESESQAPVLLNLMKDAPSAISFATTLHLSCLGVHHVLSVQDNFGNEICTYRTIEDIPENTDN